MKTINRHQISEEEWQIRVDLAALYRMVAHFRMIDIIDTHITAKLPGPGHLFLINRYGVMFHEMRASDLIKIDESGQVIDERAATDPESCFVNALDSTSMVRFTWRARMPVLSFIRTLPLEVPSLLRKRACFQSASMLSSSTTGSLTTTMKALHCSQPNESVWCVTCTPTRL